MQATNLVIKNTYPPNYEKIVAYLGDVSAHKPVFCYGKSIYNPFGRKMGSDIEIHEATHARQQGDNPDAWWDKYLIDADFRLAQEIEAYGEQYALAKRLVRGKLLTWVLHQCAQELSSSAYGSLIGYAQASSKIRNYKKNVV